MRKINYLFIVVFLYVQGFTLWHMAEHAFLKHQHHGQNCQISLFCSQQDASDIPTGITIPASISFIILALVVFQQRVMQGHSISDHRQRAPPAFLF